MEKKKGFRGHFDAKNWGLPRRLIGLALKLKIRGTGELPVNGIGTASSNGVKVGAL